MRDWVLGLGAVSTLAVLVGLDLMVTLAAERGKTAVLRAVRPPRDRR